METVHVSTILANRPAWAKALIVAELDHDDSDLMTDYHNHKTSRVVAIGWRKSSREDFRALRKAAGTFAETAHLGPGLDVYTPRVVLLDDVRGNGGCYYAGQWSPWHSELQRNESGRLYSFSTREAAEFRISNVGEPHPIHFGEQLVRFAWEIKKESVEHRENYSMGAGNYLKRGGDDNSGWRVRSYELNADGRLIYGPTELEDRITNVAAFPAQKSA